MSKAHLALRGTCLIASQGFFFLLTHWSIYNGDVLFLGVGGRGGIEEYFEGKTICTTSVSVDSVAPQEGQVMSVQESDEVSSKYSADCFIGLLFSGEEEFIIASKLNPVTICFFM